MKIPFDFNTVAKAISDRGYHTEAMQSADPSQEDDEVVVDGLIYIQVGDAYLVASFWSDESTLKFLPQRTTIKDLIEDIGHIKELLK